MHHMMFGDSIDSIAMCHLYSFLSLYHHITHFSWLSFQSSTGFAFARGFAHLMLSKITPIASPQIAQEDNGEMGLKNYF
jgi:hypothetical protein